MKRIAQFFLLLLAAFPVASPVWGQNALDGVPFDLTAAAAMRVTKAGNQFVVSGTAEASLRGVTGTFEALLPLANRKLVCSKQNREASATLSNVSISSGGSALQSGTILVSVDAHVKACAGFLESDVRIVVPVTIASVGTAKRQSVYLTAGPPDVVPIGFLAASLDALAPKIRARVSSVIGSQVNSRLKVLNAAISRFVDRARAAAGAGQAGIATVALDGSDGALSVRVTFSGQVSTTTVSGWFGGI